MTAALYDNSLEEPPPADRLRAMITALASGAEIDASLRAELIDALKRHEVRRENDRRRSTRGREIEYHVWFAAAIAKELLEHHGAKSVKVAVSAAAASANWQRGLDHRKTTPEDIAKITRAYQKLKKSAGGRITTRSGAFQIAMITPAWIADAAARLTGGTSTTPAEAHGVIVKLTR